MDFTVTVPDETLSHIFWHVKDIDPYGTAIVGSTTDLGWIRVTFVNQRWRRVAIDDATLWTTLDFQLGSYWMKEFARRSKGAPLSVSDKIRRSDEQTLCDLMSAHHGRVASLNLKTTFDRPPRIVEGILSHSFDALEELVMWTISLAVGIPGQCNSLLKRSPRIRYLQLILLVFPPQFVDLDWKYPFFAQLTVLKFHPIIDLNSQFLDALRQMRSLTQLVLSTPKTWHGDIPLHCDHRCSNTREDAIYLRNMQSLVVMGMIELPIHLLRHVRLPQNARTSIMPNHSFHTSTELSTYYKLLGREVAEVFGFDPQGLPFPWAPSCASLSYEVPSGTRQAVVTVTLAHMSQPSSLATFELKPISLESLRGGDFAITLLDDEAHHFISQLRTNAVSVLALHKAGLSRKTAHLSFFPSVQCLSFRVGSRVSNPFYGLDFLELPVLLPLLRFVVFHGDSDLNLFLLMRFGNDVSNAATSGFPELDGLLKAREQMGTPLQAIYLCVAEEVALVKAGRIGETSCKDILKHIVQEAIRILEAIRGVEIVSKDFDVFATC